jgi:hypothetical protein
VLSTWSFGGRDARTAVTAFVFHVSTAPAGVVTGSCDFADAADNDAATVTATAHDKTSSFLTTLPPLERLAIVRPRLS